MQNLAESYQGPHRVIVTQTPENRGVACNTNHAMTKVTSDWVVKADDDDTAAPDLCSVVGRAILRHPEAACFALPFIVKHSREEVENYVFEKTETEPEYVLKKLPELLKEKEYGFNINQCRGQAWSAKVYQIFGDLPAEASYMDDFTRYIRSLALGPKVEIHCAPKIVLHHGSHNQSGGIYKKITYNNIRQWELFMEKFNRFSAPSCRDLATEIAWYCANYDTPAGGSELILQVRNTAELYTLRDGFWSTSVMGRIRRLRKIRKYEKVSLYEWMKIWPLPLFCFISYLSRNLVRMIKS